MSQSTLDDTNSVMMHNVPDTSYDLERASTALAVYKDIRRIPNRIVEKIGYVTKTNPAEAFFYAVTPEDKVNYDACIGKGFMRLVLDNTETQ